MPQSTVTNVKLTPITIGSRLPTFHTPKSWMSVPMAATTIAFCTSMAVSASPNPAAAATMVIGARLATNMASTCWMP